MSRKLRAPIVKSAEGFTLIELLAVMLIIGILAAIAIPAFFNQKNKATDSGAKEMAHTAQVTMESLGSAAQNGSYATASPANLNAIEKSIRTAAGTPAKPFVNAASGTAKTWTLSVRSPSGNTYTIAKNALSALTFSCTVPAGNNRGGCPSNGRWG